MGSSCTKDVQPSLSLRVRLCVIVGTMGERVHRGETGYVPLVDVEATYRRVRADVMTLTPFQLRWSHRKARRKAEAGGTHELVALKAITDEYRQRGMEVPS